MNDDVVPTEALQMNAAALGDRRQELRLEEEALFDDFGIVPV